VETPSGAEHVPVRVVGDPGELRVGPDDVVLLGVKGQGTVAALEQVQAAGGAGAPIVCLQNGVDNEREALRRHADVYGVMVYCPAVHLEPGVVQASAIGRSGVLDIGRYPSGVDARAEAVAAAFERATFASVPRPDVMRWKYAKLLTNLGNAAEAACGREAQGGPLYALARAEGEAALAAAGIAWATRQEEDERRAGVLTFGKVAGQQRGGSSTWQSLARGAGSVEVDQLNGEVVLLGRLHGVATPANALLQATVHEMVRNGEAPGSRDAATLLAQLG
jgi:2-dehydropantoate 2-reductase